MKRVSFDGIGQVLATFEAEEGVKAGQTVEIKDGTTYVDGEALEEPYIAELTFEQEVMQFPLTVPEGSVFVMGDNRNHSNDSRDYRLGTVDQRYIIGKAVFLLYPGPDSETGKQEFGRIGVICGTEDVAAGLTRAQRGNG